MGFCAKWVTLIMKCVIPVTVSAKLNKEPLPFFKPTRSISQGDPSSLYLFILIINGLSFMLNHAIGIAYIKGLRMNKHYSTLSSLCWLKRGLIGRPGNRSDQPIVADSIYSIGGKRKEEILEEFFNRDSAK